MRFNFERWFCKKKKRKETEKRCEGCGQTFKTHKAYIIHRYTIREYTQNHMQPKQEAGERE